MNGTSHGISDTPQLLWDDAVVDEADRDDSGPLYRMYYLGWTMEEGAGWKRTGLVHPPCGSRVCYAESRDGLVWTKPNLGLREFVPLRLMPRVSQTSTSPARRCV